MPVRSPHADRLAAVPVRTGSVNVLGSATRFWDYGPPERTVDLVLVHGYRGDHHGLEPVVAHLPDLRILSPDLPGFGESAPLAGVEHSIAGYGRWLDGFLAALELRGTVPLLGHSFGSIVVAHAVASGVPAPRLVLVNPIAADPLHGVNGALARVTRLYYGIGRRLPARAGRALLGNRLVVRMMSMTLAKTPDPRLRRWIHEEHDRYFSAFADRDALAEGFDASLSTDVSRATAHLRMPVLLIAGAEDMIAPVAAQRDLVDRMPRARLLVLDGVGHLIHYERPAEAADAIRSFLAESTA